MNCACYTHVRNTNNPETAQKIVNAQTTAAYANEFAANVLLLSQIKYYNYIIFNLRFCRNYNLQETLQLMGNI